MKVHIAIFITILFLFSCESNESNCECQECPEVYNDHVDYPIPVCRPESFNDSSALILNFDLDTNYLKNINSDTLEPVNTLPYLREDQGHEGYPFILGHLNYFLLNSFVMSENLELRFIYGEIPKDTIQNEVESYRIIHMLSYDSNGEFIKNETVAKRYITLGGSYSSILTKFSNNDITISTHDRWWSASGRLYSLWSDKYYVLNRDGYLKEWAKLRKAWCKE